MKIFVTGTDTGVGKTVFTALLAAFLINKRYKVAVYKPVQTGAGVKKNNTLFSHDLNFVKKMAPESDLYCDYLFKEPVAPSVAAQVNKTKIDTALILKRIVELEHQYDYVVVEGAGGIAVPIAGSYLFKNLAYEGRLKTILVSRPNLGTINHTVLSVDFIKRSQISLAGIVICKYPHDTHDLHIITAPEEITRITQAKILCKIPYEKNLNSSPISRENLLDYFFKEFDEGFLI